MKSISTTILLRFQNQVRNRVKSKTGNRLEVVQIIHETEIGDPITLVVEDGTQGPTAAVEEIRAQIVHEVRTTVAAGAIKAQVVQGTAEFHSESSIEDVMD